MERDERKRHLCKPARAARLRIVADLHRRAHAADPDPRGSSCWPQRRRRFLVALRSLRPRAGRRGRRAQGIPVDIGTCTFWAPACTIELFQQNVPAGDRERAASERFALFTLTDKAEQDDNCANIYHKSLLYLVSNAFESSEAPAGKRRGAPSRHGEVRRIRARGCPFIRECPVGKGAQRRPAGIVPIPPPRRRTEPSMTIPPPSRQPSQESCGRRTPAHPNSQCTAPLRASEACADAWRWRS